MSWAYNNMMKNTEDLYKNIQSTL